MNKPKIIAVFIAYNAEKTLKKFWDNFPKNYFDEIILVDDASEDKTFEIAKKLEGLKAYRNRINLGYGSNLKRAIAIALGQGAEIIVDIHPDAEYKTSAILPALNKVQKEGFEFVMGNRFTSVDKLLKSGMYRWKLLPLLMLNNLDRLVLGVKITDFHQGFRVYRKNLFEKVNFEANSSNYLFSFELIAQAAFEQIKIGEVPVETIYQGRKRGASFKNSMHYSFNSLKVLVLYLLARMGIRTKIFKKTKGDLKSRLKLIEAHF